MFPDMAFAQEQRNREDRLSKLQHYLQCPEAMDPVKSCDKIKGADARRRFETNDDVDPDSPTEVDRFYSKRYKRLLGLSDFQLWWKSKNSCFWILEATNRPQGRPNDALWLSSAVAAHAAHAQKGSCANSIYYRVTDTQFSLHQVLSVIIISILSWDVGFCDRHQTLVNRAMNPSGTSLTVVMHLTTELLQNWSKEHPDNQVSIVLDRVDLCLSKETQASISDRTLIYVLDEFAKIIEAQKNLKLWWTVNRRGWPSYARDHFESFKSNRARGHFLSSEPLLEVTELGW